MGSPTVLGRKKTEKALTGYDLVNTRNGNLMLGYFISPIGPKSSYWQLKLTIGSLMLIEALPHIACRYVSNHCVIQQEDNAGGRQALSVHLYAILVGGQEQQK
ncbi:hypothetical protein BDV93DRAFT_513573 [Ceratobasidium sp. AG-I]|nr:hypothetical protein BDV93DRAFT_513573 [Ceratobasidium sp. AG-I]